MFLIELKRGFSRLSFKIAFFIGIIFCILNLVKFPMYQTNILEIYIEGFITTPFNNFILFNLNHISNMLVLILPIISTISYSDSYIEDVKSGLVKNIYTREKKLKYLLSKYFANFLVSGVAVSIPLLLNYLILIMLYPSIQPDALFSGTTIMKGGLFAKLFYGHANLYIIMWIIIYFLYSGAFASIALCFSKIIKNKFVILFIPFVIYYLFEIFCEIAGKLPYSPEAFLYILPHQYFSIILLEFIIIFIVTFSIFCFGGLKNDTY